MRIARATVIGVGGMLPVPVGNAGSSWHERRGLVLRLFDDDGNMGQGEASPLPGYSPDDLGAVRGAFAREPWLAVPEIDERVAIAPQVRHLVDGVDPGIPSARFALETALLDLLGLRVGRPVHDILAGGAPCGRVPVARLIDSEKVAECLAASRRALHRGIRTLKVKVGRDFARELELLRALRAELGDGIAIRLDANRSFPPAEARERLRELATLAPSMIEEPVVPEALADLVSAPVPIALDESLAGDEGLRLLSRLTAAGVCKWVVLKPTVLGGVLACMEIARRARAGGAEPIVSHTFDGPLAMAASAELAVALPPPRHAAGLDRHAALRAWPDIDVPTLTGAELVPSEEPGLGIAPVPASPR
jgi:o-succinylbenzoate synthase